MNGRTWARSRAIAPIVSSILILSACSSSTPTAEAPADPAPAATPQAKPKPRTATPDPKVLATIAATIAFSNLGPADQRAMCIGWASDREQAKVIIRAAMGDTTDGVHMPTVWSTIDEKCGDVR